MPVIDEQSREVIRKKLADEMKDDVEVKIFSQKINLDPNLVELNQFTVSFVKELAEINPKIRLIEISLTDELAKKYGLTTPPSIMIGEEKGFRIIYNGSPIGYEATGFIETIILVSRNESGLEQKFLDKLATIDKPTHIQVFVTPTCPYCPKAVVLANKISIATKGLVTAECVEAQENAVISQKFNVSSVPQQVINSESASITIGVPEEAKFIDQILSYGSSKYPEMHAKELAEMTEHEKLPDDPAEAVFISDHNFDKALAKYENLVIDCWAEWCGPCKMITPIIEELAAEYKGRIVFGKLNIDENVETAARFKVMSIPTLLFFVKGGKVDELSGALPKKALNDKVAAVFKL
jgi:thioredoxin